MKTSKMTPSGSPASIAPSFPLPPQQFRAQATGIGQTRQASLATGSARAQHVSDCMTPAARAALPKSSGYPEPTPELGHGLMAMGYGTRSY